MRRGRPPSSRPLSRGFHPALPPLSRMGTHPAKTLFLLRRNQTRVPEKAAFFLRSARRERWLPDLRERRRGKGVERRGEWRSGRHPGDSKASLLPKKRRGSLRGGSFDGLGSGLGNPNESSDPEGKRLDYGSARSPKRPGNAAGREGGAFSTRENHGKPGSDL